MGDAGAGSAEARVLCKACGLVQGFSPDGRFLFYNPEAKVKDDPKRKLTVRLLEVASLRSSGDDGEKASADPLESIRAPRAAP